MEPPGTAPGSDPLITRALYHHSLQADLIKIGVICINAMPIIRVGRSEGAIKAEKALPAQRQRSIINFAIKLG